jgi:hypothetical protein
MYSTYINIVYNKYNYKLARNRSYLRVTTVRPMSSLLCYSETELHRISVFLRVPSSGILETRKHDISETGSVSVLRCGGKTPTHLGPFERANLNHWITPVGFTHERLSRNVRRVDALKLEHNREH